MPGRRAGEGAGEGRRAAHMCARRLCRLRASKQRAMMPAVQRHAAHLVHNLLQLNVLGAALDGGAGHHLRRAGGQAGGAARVSGLDRHDGAPGACRRLGWQAAMQARHSLPGHCAAGTAGRAHHLGCGVGDAARQGLGREAGKHHREHGADARARQHDGGQLQWWGRAGFGAGT